MLKKLENEHFLENPCILGIPSIPILFAKYHLILFNSFTKAFSILAWSKDL